MKVLIHEDSHTDHVPPAVIDWLEAQDWPTGFQIQAQNKIDEGEATMTRTNGRLEIKSFRNQQDQINDLADKLFGTSSPYVWLTLNNSEEPVIYRHDGQGNILSTAVFTSNGWKNVE